MQASFRLKEVDEGILYVVITGYTWKDVPRNYISKSTVNKFPLYLCEHDTYQKIFNELLNKGSDFKKIDFSHFFLHTYT
jgi:putative transposase